VEDKDVDKVSNPKYAKIQRLAKMKFWALPTVSYFPHTNDGLILESMEELNDVLEDYRKFGSFGIQDKAGPEFSQSVLRRRMGDSNWSRVRVWKGDACAS
jgi:hypothetical protein